MRHVSGLVSVTALALLGTGVRTASADKPYASAGVVSLGGTAQLFFSSQSFTPDGADESVDSSTTSVDLEPVIGYFVIPRLELFGGLLLAISKESPDEGDDQTTTAFGALIGAGYYIPAGTVWIGPRADVAYAKAKTEVGDNDASSSGFQFDGAGALRVPFGFGGLLDIAAVVRYGSQTLESNDDTIGDRSQLNFGAEIGFFVFF